MKIYRSGQWQDLPFKLTASAFSGAEGDWRNTRRIYFNASKSNSIYGASSTVQPNAYFIKAWRRTA